MASFMEYQRQADEMYLKQMREQREIEAQLRREEIKAQKDSSEVFARLLSEIYLRRENNSVHPPQGQRFPFSGFKLFWTLTMQTKTKKCVKHVIVLVHY